MRGAAVAVLALLLASGCSGKGGQPAATPTNAAGTGEVHGVVVTEAIVPVAGATVRLDVVGASAVTDAAGGFTFAGLAPGAHLLTASANGTREAQTTIQVDAGKTSNVNLVLARDSSGLRFAEAYVFEGFVNVSLQVVTPVASPRSSGTSADFLMGIRQPDLIQSEAVWESTQSLGSDLDLTATVKDDNLTTPEIGRAKGPSPLALTLNSTAIHDAHLGPTEGLVIIIFSGAEQPAAGVGAGAAVQQRVRLVTHMFYGFTPPDGWRFSVDGEPVPPA